MKFKYYVNNKMVDKEHSASDNISTFIDDDININDRIIHLFGKIEGDKASKVIKGLQLMEVRNTDPIDIYIHSFGGCPYASFGLVDYIRSLESITVRTYIIGCGMSGGSLVFMAGDERIMYKHSRLMLHTVASVSDGKIFEMKKETQECEVIFNDMCELYSSNSDKSIKQWANLLKYEDKYFDCYKAKEIGLCTKIK